MLVFLEGLLALGLWPLLFIGALFIALVIGVSLDRKANLESPKWWILGIGFAVIVIYGWQHLDWSAGSLWSTMTSAAFWLPIAEYVVFGLVYAGVEFFFDIRRHARMYAEQWQAAINSSVTVPKLDADGKPMTREQPMVDRWNKPVSDNSGKQAVEVVNLVEEKPLKELIISVRDKGEASQYYKIVAEHVKAFIKQYDFRNRVVELALPEGNVHTPEPRVNKIELAEHVGAWTFFWPFYLVSLVIGDLVTEIFRVVADFLASISGRFVRMTFADVFKLS